MGAKWVIAALGSVLGSGRKTLKGISKLPWSEAS